MQANRAYLRINPRIEAAEIAGLVSILVAVIRSAHAATDSDG
jgi:hypothetical protein